MRPVGGAVASSRSWWGPTGMGDEAGLGVAWKEDARAGAAMMVMTKSILMSERSMMKYLQAAEGRARSGRKRRMEAPDARREAR